MNIRDALIQQSPSLALQREAQAEIAWLDSELELMIKALIRACLGDAEVAQAYIDAAKESK